MVARAAIAGGRGPGRTGGCSAPRPVPRLEVLLPAAGRLPAEAGLGLHERDPARVVVDLPELVTAAPPERDVRAGAAADPVVAGLAPQQVVARFAEEQAVARAVGQDIVAVAPLQLVVAAPALDRVVAAADQQVVAAVAAEEVVAVATVGVARLGP